MNRRKYKKLMTKFGKKHFIDARREQIMCAVRHIYHITRDDVIVITDSSKMNFKHPLNIKILSDFYLAG